MNRHSSGFIIWLVVSIILGFGIIAVVWVGLASNQGLGYEPPALQATKAGPNTAELDLSTYPDSMVCHAGAPNPQIGWVTYCASTNAQGSNIEVPPNSIVTVVIKNYDTATPLINDYFRQVQGTIGGVELVNNKPVSQIDASAVSHTFTIQSTPDASYPLYVSAPLLGVPDNAPNAVTINGNPYPKPNVMTFQFRTGPPGTYIWHCYDPCGSDRKPPYGFGGPMATTGYMSGTLTVSSY